jgi:beta-lactam-binding protein with PASTA domain
MSTQVADPLIGSLVDGRYRVRGRVARGGMATVYTALDERLERTVALKIIHPAQVSDSSFLDKFTDEAKTVARLTHPNVVAVYDQGTHAGLPYLVMEYVRGRTLRDILSDRRRLTPAEALAVMEQVLSALGAAHHAGLVHRDVKPENVLVAESPSSSSLVDAVAKVADFGLARAVEASAEDPEAGQLMATVAYVAPELVAEGFADPRSDVYSAGVMLFEMLTGRVPYDAERPVDVAWQHVDRDVPPPSRYAAALPHAIDELVVSATRRDPASRPTDAGALLNAVQAAREGLAGGNAATQRLRPIAQDTVIVSQVTERPSWARLPAAPPARPRQQRTGRQHRPKATLAGQLRELHRRIVSNQRGRTTLAIALAGILVLVLVGGWWLAFGRFEAAPDLQRMTLAAAQAKAQEAGLKVELGQGEFREDVAKDIVLVQEPGPGGRVVKGGTIKLIVSLGAERYPVPNVVGKTLELATADLSVEPMKFQVTQGAPVFSDASPAGTVVSTVPAVGEGVKPGGVVQVILSKGRAPITIPSVVGLQVNEATSMLQGLGLKVITVPGDDATKPKGEVLEQNPPGGGSAERGNEVTLKVNQNGSVAAMPRVIGQNCQGVAGQFRGAGYPVRLEGDPVSMAVGNVEKQSPEAGKPLQAGQEIVLTCKFG